MSRSSINSAQTVGGQLEANFDAVFASQLAIKEKQIQQNYRPIIGIHKWFARRPGTLFRSLILAEYLNGEAVDSAYWRGHSFRGIIADPFMGGGTPVFEANRLGFDVVGCDINPMAHWIVRQSLSALDLVKFRKAAAEVVRDVEKQIGSLYLTRCSCCGKLADVKYFLWVKTATCPSCKESVDLFPGYRLAENERHPNHVIACGKCGTLNECAQVPTAAMPHACSQCGTAVTLEGNVRRQKATCRKCTTEFPFALHCSHPPRHRLWAIEYHCSTCYEQHDGRQFKAPDGDDLKRVQQSSALLMEQEESLDLPAEQIPSGDESDRLHRWGYRRYREMFNDRQLVGLGLLRNRIAAVPDRESRLALLTVFSDTLRYQNMLCRYDTYALKCQDIFSVHGFPVGLIQCENNVLGIDSVGSGAFRHFVEKYSRAKEYCHEPFETRQKGKKKELVPIAGETLCATLVSSWPSTKSGRTDKEALLINRPSQKAPLEPSSLAGVFTDPPYFDNVQYAELMDFCFVWLRQALNKERGVPHFKKASTRSEHELTGNETLGRGLEHFAGGISEVFCHFAKALKPGAPFVFTYHHNDPFAYLPLVLGILDSGLHCTATLPAVGEMSASLHIAGTDSSVLDSVFVCRRPGGRPAKVMLSVRSKLKIDCLETLSDDAAKMRLAGVEVTPGDLRCLVAGHIARYTISDLLPEWNAKATLPARLALARQRMRDLMALIQPESLVGSLATLPPQGQSVSIGRIPHAASI